jgi:hypothetical protein
MKHLKLFEALELRKIEIPSPIDTLKIGDDFSYKGQYKDGYEEGISKIKRFYKEVAFWDGVEMSFHLGMMAHRDARFSSLLKKLPRKVRQISFLPKTVLLFLTMMEPYFASNPSTFNLSMRWIESRNSRQSIPSGTT